MDYEHRLTQFLRKADALHRSTASKPDEKFDQVMEILLRVLLPRRVRDSTEFYRTMETGSSSAFCKCTSFHRERIPTVKHIMPVRLRLNNLKSHRMLRSAYSAQRRVLDRTSNRAEFLNVTLNIPANLTSSGLRSSQDFAFRASASTVQVWKINRLLSKSLP